MKNCKYGKVKKKHITSLFFFCFCIAVIIYVKSQDNQLDKYGKQ